ncbi:MaoC/PaaZ C-terminal domain-containing protein [Streptomyces sp. NPDC004596]|uniref:MaoC/PaaZ C-terminal domain-containing protein n=1 Tax=Streptomyces sp. DSM 118148 TaxID=3448667 RepID=UPI00403FF25A
MTLWFDDLVVGRSWSSPSRTVTEADVGDFAGLTGDRFPLHTSEEYAKRTQFGTRVAHGLLGLTFAHGLMWARTGELDESVIAFLGIREWSFAGAIHFGDTIDVTYAVVAQRPSSSKPDRGVVEFEVRVTNQHDVVVQHGIKTMLIARKDPR